MHVALVCVLFVVVSFCGTVSPRVTTGDSSSPGLSAPSRPKVGPPVPLKSVPQRQGGGVRLNSPPSPRVPKNDDQQQVSSKSQDKGPPLPSGFLFSQEFKAKVGDWKGKRSLVVLARLNRVEDLKDKGVMLNAKVLAVLFGPCKFLAAEEFLVPKTVDFAAEMELCKFSDKVKKVVATEGKQLSHTFVFEVTVAQGILTVQGVFSDFSEMFFVAAKTEDLGIPFCSFFGGLIPMALPEANKRANELFSAAQKKVTPLKRGDFVSYLNSNKIAGLLSSESVLMKFYKLVSEGELTINFRMHNLVKLAQSGYYKNSFELRKPGQKLTGLTDPRSAELIYAPYCTIPSLDWNSKTYVNDAMVLPKFLGLNVGGSFLGAAPAYGSCVLVMKDEIRKQSAVIAADSLLIIPKPPDFVQRALAMKSAADGDSYAFGWGQKLTALRKSIGFFTQDGLWNTIQGKLELIKQFLSESGDYALQTEEQKQGNAAKKMTEWITALLNLKRDNMGMFQESDTGEVRNIFEVHVFGSVELSKVAAIRIPFGAYFGTSAGELAMRMQSPQLEIWWYLDCCQAIVQPPISSNDYLTHFVPAWKEVSQVRVSAENGLSTEEAEKRFNALFTKLQAFQKTRP